MAGLVQRITMQDVKEKLGKLSLTNQYQVNFSSLKKTITDYLELSGIDNAKEFPTIADLMREQKVSNEEPNSVHHRRDLDSLG